jgi:hypothetical protein
VTGTIGGAVWLRPTVRSSSSRLSGCCRPCLLVADLRLAGSGIRRKLQPPARGHGHGVLAAKHSRQLFLERGDLRADDEPLAVTDARHR